MHEYESGFAAKFVGMKHKNSTAWFKEQDWSRLEKNF